MLLKNWISTCKKRKKNELGLLPSTIYTKINSKWVIDLNTRAQTLPLLEENIGQGLRHTGVGHDILNLTQRHKKQEQQSRQTNFTKMKSFCAPKETVNRVRRQPTEWEKTLADHLYGKDLYSQYLKNA